MFRKSKKWIGIIIVLVLMIFGGICIPKLLPVKTLTTEQKLEDFYYFYNDIVEYHPLLEEYKEVLGYDFEGNKEYYEELIRNTKDDYEFYVMMNMIMEEIPSLHTGDYIMSFDEIRKGGNNYSKEVSKAFWGRDQSEYWNEHHMNYMLEDNGKSYFSYYDGQYIGCLDALHNQEERTQILLAIDDEPIDEYILRKEVNGKWAYDEYNDKVYRRDIELNLRYGQLVTATFQNGSGEVFEREIYIRNKDCAFEGERIAFVDIPQEEKLVIPEVDVSDVQYIKKESQLKVIVDNERNLTYVCIYSLNDSSIDWKEVVDGMQKACEKDNIILDLRINEGGHVERVLEYIYPWLFKEDITVLREYSVTKAVLDGKLARQYPYIVLSEGQDMVRLQNKYQGKGNGVEDKNVYVLIGNITASAADWAAATLKEYTNASVIGTNTLGEGLGRTAFIDIMPNSKLTFRVYDSLASNLDGTNNSIYPTSPEYYIPYTFESIAKRNQLMKENVSVYDYENRLKWDNVLLETIQMIENKEE